MTFKGGQGKIKVCKDETIRLLPFHFVFSIFRRHMSAKFKSEDEIIGLVREFEEATISREAWRHAEHLTVALYYCSTSGLETATQRMRSGIFRLLEAFGVDLTREMPYHETLTIFWMRTVNDFDKAKNGESLMEKVNELVELFDKDYPLRFYSRERLFSDEARARFIEADLIDVRADRSA